MKTLKTLLLCLAAISIISCDDDNDPTNNVCDTAYTATLINSAFSTANGYVDQVTMDLATHEYSIQINADGEICTIGYQNPSSYTGGYTMEVINTTANTSYSGIHTFSQAALDYQSITPVIVQAGDIINVKRTILPGFTSDQTIGRMFTTATYSNIAYPITEGNVVFLGSTFYGTGGPNVNFGQPYIPLGFKVN
ncbi:hypothetical protein ACRASX_05845 [Flavobacterium sp. TMP13]|uniref:hypothetical protein n=1 Tax=Flavobacterium sp. TMP13 TaxID=3425950 RepID=UPI003D77B911